MYRWHMVPILFADTVFQLKFISYTLATALAKSWTSAEFSWARVLILACLDVALLHAYCIDCYMPTVCQAECCMLGLQNFFLNTVIYRWYMIGLSLKFPCYFHMSVFTHRQGRWAKWLISLGMCRFQKLLSAQALQTKPCQVGENLGLIWEFGNSALKL